MQKSHFLICSILLIQTFSCKAQLVMEWQRCYGGSGFEQPFTTEKCLDGGLISAGFSNSTDGDITGNLGNYDWWIIKTDKDGNLQWKRNYGGSNYDKCRAIMQNDDGSFMAFGSSHSSNGDLTMNHGEADFWLLKLDSAGNILSNQVWGGSAEEGGRGIIRTHDRGWMLVGWAASNDGDIIGNHGTKDAWLCKLDSNANVQWSKCYGGSLEDRARYIIQLNDGSYVFGGNAKSSDGDLTINKGGEDFWIAKVDSAGNLIWNTPMGSSADDRIYYVAADWDGGFLGVGRNGANDGDVSDNHGQEDLWIIKVDSTGMPVWNKSLGGSLDDGGFRIESTPDHGYFITGMTRSADGDSPGTNGQSDYWFIKLDSSLYFVWNDHIGGSRADHCNDIIKTDDGGYFLTGFTLSNDTTPIAFDNRGQADFWFVKAYFCEGKDTSLNAGSTSICPGSTTTISTSSYQNYSWNTGDTTQTLVVSTPGIYFVSMSDYSGYCQYTSDTVMISQFQSPPVPTINSAGPDLTTSGSGSFQWYFNGSLIPGASGMTLTNVTQNGIYTVVVTDLNGCTTQSADYNLSVGTDENSINNFSLIISPNPFYEKTKVVILSPYHTTAEVKIYGLSGQFISERNLKLEKGKNLLELDLTPLQSGTYILHIVTEDETTITKLLVHE